MVVDGFNTFLLIIRCTCLFNPGGAGLLLLKILEVKALLDQIDPVEIIPPKLVLFDPLGYQLISHGIYGNDLKKSITA